MSDLEERTLPMVGAEPSILDDRALRMSSDKAITSSAAGLCLVSVWIWKKPPRPSSER